MLVVFETPDGYLVAREATRWRRALARACGHRLDRQLANGASPDKTELLALRAQLLVRPATRRRIARTFAGVLQEATVPCPRHSSRVPVQAESVRTSADAIQALIDRLETPAPLAAHGIAHARLLLEDGAGPLYDPCSRHQLRATIETALEMLEPLSSWEDG